MAAETKESKEKVEHHSAFYTITRRILLAGIGAFVIAQDEMEDFIDRLVENGEIAEKDARKLMREMMEKREKMLKERHQTMSRARSDTATKADVEALNAKISELTKKLEELKKA